MVYYHLMRRKKLFGQPIIITYGLYLTRRLLLQTYSEGITREDCRFESKLFERKIRKIQKEDPKVQRNDCDIFQARSKNRPTWRYMLNVQPISSNLEAQSVTKRWLFSRQISRWVVAQTERSIFQEIWRSPGTRIVAIESWVARAYAPDKQRKSREEEYKK